MTQKQKNKIKKAPDEFRGLYRSFNLPNKKFLNGGVKGNGISLGLDDGTNKLGLTGRQNNINFLSGNTGAYGINVGVTITTKIANALQKGIGIITDPTKSGVICDPDSDVIYIIKY